MAEVVIHIGTEKTGTTSIQHFLSENREPLLAKGILYPVLGSRKDAHFDLVNSVHPLDNGGRYMEFIGSPNHSTDFLWGKLRDCIAANPTKKIVLSAEHFSSRLRGNALKYISDFFNALGIRPKIVIYLRPQADFIESSYSTEIKAGGTRVFKKVLEQYKTQPMRYNYKDLVGLWEEYFGKEAITIIPYEKSFIGNDIRRHFLQLLGVDNVNGIDFSSKPLNQRWSPPMLELARIVNLRMTELSNQERFNFLEYANTLISESIVSGDFSLMTEEQYKEVTTFFEDSNKVLCQNYLPGRESLFLDGKKPKTFRKTEQDPLLTHFDLIKLIYNISSNTL